MFKKTKISFLFLFLFCNTSQATQIVIVNQDAAGEGFNDNTPVSPVGGNSGTTIGQQRLQVFEFAARIWESLINSNVTIRVEAKFDPLTCTATQGVLGSAGTLNIYRDFTNAPVSNTWYSIALANSLFGSDLSSSADITATFNSDIDNNSACIGNYNWYYGIDGVRPSSTFELLSVVLHEIGHGLGFQTFVNINTGAKFGNPGRDDMYMLNLEDHSLAQGWSSMTNNQRQASAIDTADLHWTGSAVTSRVSDFSAGVNQGHIRMYAPSPVEGGSSVSHFSKTLSPNELMEPTDTGPKQGAGLAKELFQDIGWNIFSNFKPVISKISDTTYNPASNQISFIIRDTDNILSSLTLTAASSNASVIDASAMVLSGSANVRTLTMSPQSAGVASITITVSDGVNSVTESFQLTVTNTSPTVSIDVPANNINYATGSNVLFQATANDAEDGDLSSSVLWTSSIDGALGSGNIINSVLTLGSHQITASATDSFSTTVTSNITVNILGDSDVDGMNDAWEIENFGDLSRDGSSDFNNNGITDLDEYLISITVPNGDINNDGQINVADVLLATQHINNLSSLSALQIARGDLYPANTPDGVFNLSDLILLQKIIHNIP